MLLASPEIALAMTPNGKAAVLFFTTETAHVGQARWLGERWEPGLDGTKEDVASIARAWISEDGYRSWVSYELKKGRSFPLGSETFSAGLPFGATASVFDFQFPYRQVSFETPPQEIVLDRTGNAAAAFLDSEQFQYLIEDLGFLGDNSLAPYSLPHALAAGEQASSALISFRDRIIWEEARSDGSLSPPYLVDDATVNGLPKHTFVPFGLAYTSSDDAWGAWRVVPPIEESSPALIRVGQLSPDRDHVIWELTTIPSPRFLRGGGLTVSRDGEVAAVTWGYRFSDANHVRLAWIKDGRLVEGITHALESPPLCRLSEPALSASGDRVLVSALCSDFTAYVMGANWIMKLPGTSLGLPTFALSDSGDLALVAWAVHVPSTATFRIETRTLVW